MQSEKRGAPLKQEVRLFFRNTLIHLLGNQRKDTLTVRIRDG